MPNKNHIQIVIDAKDQFSKAFTSLTGGLTNIGKAAGVVFGGIAATGAAAGAGLYAMTASTAKAYDSVAKLSGRLGVSTQFLTEYHYAADLCGVSSDEFNGSLQYMIRNVGEASQGVGTAKDAFKMLGLSIDDIKKMSPEKQFETITQALEGVKSANDRVSIAMDIFGRSGAGVIQMVNAGSASLTEYRKEADKYGVSLSGPAGKAAEDFIDSQARIKTAFTGVKNTISEALMPTITTLSNKFAAWIGDVRESKIKDFFDDLSKKLEETDWEGFASRLGDVATAVGKIASAAGTAFAAMTNLGNLAGEKIFGPIDERSGAEKRLEELREKINKAKIAVDEYNSGKRFGIKANIEEDIKAWQAEAAEIQHNIDLEEERKRKIEERKAAQRTVETPTTEDKKDGKDPDIVAAQRAIAAAKAAADEKLAIEKATIEEIRAAHADYYMTQEQQLDAWHEAQLTKLGENKEAQAELEQLYREKKAELHEEDLLAEDENTELAREKLSAWYAEQHELYKNNAEKLAEIDAKHLKQKNKIDDRERKEKLKREEVMQNALLQMEEVSGIKGLGISKGFRIKETIMNTRSAAMGAYNALAPIPIIGPVLGAAAAAAAIAYGAQQIATIAGAAHGGLTNVPEESTYLLQKGERVLSPNQNRDLTDFMDGGMGTTVNVGDLSIFIQADNKKELMDMKASDWEEVMNENFFPALGKIFSLRGVPA